MRVAIVHDWLLGMRGGERCLECILDFFPEADIFTLFYDANNVTDVIRSKKVYSSILNRLPGVKKYYRHLLPFYSLGIKSLESKLADGKYELVISISHCVAKNIRVPKDAYHLCYCLTPARYLFDQYDSYFGGKWFEPFVRPIFGALRRQDVKRAQGVDHYVAISEFVAKRIRTYYERDADVVYPPVRTDWISARSSGEQGSGFLCVNALVPYKNAELVIRSFNELKLPLTIVGTGPLEEKLRGIAAPHIRFISRVDEAQLALLYRQAQALIFAAEEDFGMVPVEIMAAGRPVICYARGGVLETMTRSDEAPTGIYFSELTTASLATAVRNFIVRQEQFTVENCVSQARNFSLERFRDDFSRVLQSCGFSNQFNSETGKEKRQMTAR